MATTTDTSRFSTSTVPRDPPYYRPSIHFYDRFHNRIEEPGRRHLDGEIIDKCIIEGSVSKEPDNCFGFRRFFGGVEYALIVNPHTRKVVTGHPTAIRWKPAKDSGRWSQVQLEEINEFLKAR